MSGQAEVIARQKQEDTRRSTIQTFTRWIRRGRDVIGPRQQAAEWIALKRGTHGDVASAKITVEDSTGAAQATVYYKEKDDGSTGDTIGRGADADVASSDAASDVRL